MAVAASNLQFKPEEVAEDQDDLIQPGRSKKLDKTCTTEVRLKKLNITKPYKDKKKDR